jgi:hypothetical protein
MRKCKTLNQFWKSLYVLVSRCVYFLICICIKYWLIRILSLVVSYIHPSRQIICSYALQTKAGTEEDLRIHIAKGNKLTHLFDDLFKYTAVKDTQRRKIVLVEEYMAELNIMLDGDCICFDIKVFDPFYTDLTIHPSLLRISQPRGR